MPLEHEIATLTTKIQAVRLIKKWYIDADDFQEAMWARLYERRLVGLMWQARAGLTQPVGV